MAIPTYTKWTHCPTCLTQQDHTYIPGEGWICDKCKLVNPNLRIGPEIQVIAYEYSEKENDDAETPT